MATKKITGLHNGSIVVSTSGNTYNIAEGAKVIGSAPDSMSSGPSGAIMEDPTAMPVPRNNTFNIDGRVIGSQVGVIVTGAGDEVHIGETGKVSGAIGAAVGGNNATLTNDGEITGIQGGMYAISGSKIHMTNNGDVFGIIGMATSDADKVLIVNGNQGHILGIQYGVNVSSSTGEHAKFVNHGSVLATIADTAAFLGGSGNETVINDGTLQGIVDLGGGDDSIDNRGGKIVGSIVAGLGDDTLITDKASVKLSENAMEGDDTVKSTVTYKLSDNVENLFLLGKTNINGTGTTLADKLHGNAGNNTLTGGMGDDELWGGKGSDHLNGGGGADTFHFAKGGGADVITHFDQGSDLADLSAWTGIGNFTAVLNHAQDEGSGVRIELGGDSLVIGNLHKADLLSTDFVF